MEKIQLSKRLLEVAKYVPENSITADIGSDHALLPCYLIQQKIAKKAIAGEINEGPYQTAKRQVEKCGLQHLISVRKGDGLSIIENDEPTCVVIAGMGGSLIQKILEEGKEKLKKAERLVLQPNIHSIEVRKWLLQHDWELDHESILEEDGKIYEVLAAKRGDGRKPYENMPMASALLMGPFLMKEKSPVFRKKWNHELKHWQSVLKQLENAEETKQIFDKKEEIQQTILAIKEVI